LTVEELSAIYPKLIPLSELYGYPFEKEKVIERVKARYPMINDF